MPRLGLGQSLTGGAVAEALTPFTNNYSMNFDGTDDYVDLGTAGQGDVFGAATIDHTISLWIKSSDDAASRYFSSVGSSNQPAASFEWYGSRLNNFFRDASGNVVMNEKNSGASGGNPHTGSWVHCVTVMKRGSTDTCQWYRNGSVSGAEVDISGYAGVDSAIVLTENTYLGCSIDGTTVRALYEGLMNDVAIWNVALTTADVESIYNSGVPNDLRLAVSYDTDRTGNLKGYWIFEEGSGSTVEDLSGEGNDGTINSATFDTDVPE